MKRLKMSDTSLIALGLTSTDVWYNSSLFIWF